MTQYSSSVHKINDVFMLFQWLGNAHDLQKKNTTYTFTLDLSHYNITAHSMMVYIVNSITHLWTNDPMIAGVWQWWPIMRNYLLLQLEMYGFVNDVD